MSPRKWKAKPRNCLNLLLIFRHSVENMISKSLSLEINNFAIELSPKRSQTSPLNVFKLVIDFSLCKLFSINETLWLRGLLLIQAFKNNTRTFFCYYFDKRSREPFFIITLKKRFTIGCWNPYEYNPFLKN